jgi:tetratricopeptide (TPR) repeat protein
VRRATLIALLFVAVNAQAAEKWWDAYNRGVAAVNGASYDAGAKALAAAIAQNPTESTGVRAGNSIITYVPHFFLGIAKFNLGDTDGALREWRISEEQGAVARTAYYSKLKDWVARAQQEKQREAVKAASGSKQTAEAAISRAVQLQGDALSAGGDRTESYRDAQRKLQDALARFRGAGTNNAAYESAAQTAEQAAQRFAAAADEGKKLKIAAANRPKPQPPQPKPQPVEVVVQVEDAPKPVVKTETVAPPPVVVVPRKEEPKPAPLPEPIKPVPAPVIVARPDVTPAYRAFATGDLATADRLLTNMLAKTPAAEAYLLRGCVRYTRAMLSRQPDAQLAAATADFKAALARNRALRLDPSVFSPKLVARFEQVRNNR